MHGHTLGRGDATTSPAEPRWLRQRSSLCWLVASALSIAACHKESATPVDIGVDLGCGPSTCGGCCLLSGTCMPGESPTVCGHSGLLCVACGAGKRCQKGECVNDVLKDIGPDRPDSPPPPPWWDSSWTRRRAMTITNPGKALSGYQVAVPVPYRAGMQPGFADVRFVDPGGTPLSFWLETSTPSQHATFWVRVPSLPPGVTVLHLYYGNGGAKPASSGVTTFEFFDDFDDNTLDSGRWTIGVNTDGKGSAQETGSRLELMQEEPVREIQVNGSPFTIQLAADQKVALEYTVETRLIAGSCRTHTPSGSLVSADGKWWSALGYSGWSGEVSAADQVGSTKVGTTSAQEAVIVAAGQVVKSSEDYAVLWNEKSNSTATPAKLSTTVTRTGVSGVTSGYVRLGFQIGGNTTCQQKCAFDTVRVRKLAVPEPAAVVGNVEEQHGG